MPGKEILMNDAEQTQHESTTLNVPRKQTRRSRKKLTLLSARAIDCTNAPVPRKSGRHQWTEATRFKREKTLHSHKENAPVLESSNEKHEGIAQKLLVEWCIFIALASMAAITF